MPIEHKYFFIEIKKISALLDKLIEKAEQIIFPHRKPFYTLMTSKPYGKIFQAQS